MSGESFLKDLTVRFVNIYSVVPDTGLDVFMRPPPWFIPINSNVAKREAAKYFLLAASLSDSELTGNPRNIRILLEHLHSVFGAQLYAIKKPSEFAYEVTKCELEMRKLDRLGSSKAEIPEVLCSVNRFVDQKALGDLIDYTSGLANRGLKPSEFVKELSYRIKRMNGQHKAKAWLYMRWMVRGPPDLGLFKFDSKDLTVPLNTPQLRVAVALGVLDDESLPFDLNSKNKPSSWWKSTAEFDDAQNRLTSFARTLFPDDPAKVDFPFFILGTWLEDSDLTPISLERALNFFIQKFQEMQKPPLRYLIAVQHYSQNVLSCELGAFGGFENEVYDFLKNRQAEFHYEFLEFNLPRDRSITRGSPTYTPDFLLPQVTDKGRKVLLEPHGVRSNLAEFLAKLSLFRKHYGDYYCLVLIVPDDFIEMIERLDPNRLAYDFLWKRSAYKNEFERFRSS